MSIASNPDDPRQYLELSELNRAILSRWIESNFIRTKTHNRRYNSYVLKHKFEDSPQGFYVTNGSYKGACLAAGFKPHDPNALNPFYTISNRSPAILNRRGRRK